MCAAGFERSQSVLHVSSQPRCTRGSVRTPTAVLPSCCVCRHLRQPQHIPAHGRGGMEDQVGGPPGAVLPVGGASWLPAFVTWWQLVVVKAAAEEAVGSAPGAPVRLMAVLGD